MRLECLFENYVKEVSTYPYRWVKLPKSAYTDIHGGLKQIISTVFLWETRHMSYQRMVEPECVTVGLPQTTRDHNVFKRFTSLLRIVTAAVEPIKED